MDILEKDFQPNGTDRPSSGPNLTVTIISKYSCTRCKKIFSKIKSLRANPNNAEEVDRLYKSILDTINANRSSQMHFCNHDPIVDGKFLNSDDVKKYLCNKIDSHESIEVGPADYLGSNIIKDKSSRDV